MRINSIRRATVIVEPHKSPDNVSKVSPEYWSQPKKNVVIFGTPRGGTTMIAGIAQLCGVNIGSELSDNLEDQAFVDRSHEDMITTIRHRNSMQDVWGWKYPRAATYLEALQDHLTNPHYIIVWRDVFATALRRIQNTKSVLAEIRTIQALQNENLALFEKLNGPCLMVSYDRSLSNPLELAVDICNFLNLPKVFNRRKISDFSLPGKYKEVRTSE